MNEYLAAAWVPSEGELPSAPPTGTLSPLSPRGRSRRFQMNASHTQLIFKVRSRSAEFNSDESCTSAADMLDQLSRVIYISGQGRPACCGALANHCITCKH